MKISSVLIIGPPQPHSHELGADIATGFKEAQDNIHSPSYRVIVVPISKQNQNDALQFLRQRLERFPSTRFILNAEAHCEDAVIDAIQIGSVVRIVEGYSDPNFESAIRESLERASMDQQDEDLLQLIHERTAQLKTLKSELEESVQRRTRSLEKSKAKLIETNAKVEILHAALVAIHTATSVAEMEAILTKTLSEKFAVTNTRILFSSQSSIEEHTDKPNVYQVQLSLAGGKAATVAFTRAVYGSFSKNEELFLDQVAEATGLALDRHLTLTESENLKKQWDATFDAILDPLCLTTLDYEIIRTNRAFCKLTKKEFSEVTHHNALTLVFGEGTALSPELTSEKFKILKDRSRDDALQTFEVSGATFLMPSNSKRIRWLLIRDVTEAKRMERQLLETAKMAELGTIGSSIAHELNNPIGGMLSFLQLIKMDVPVADTNYADIHEMEKATIRCKEIVENLLGFARQSSLEPAVLDLRTLLQQIVNLTNLENRSTGLQLDFHCPEGNLPFLGQANLLQQALHNVLQNASEAVSDRVKSQTGFIGRIKIELKVTKTKYVLSITDNGLGIDTKNLRYIFNPLFSTKNPQTNSGLGLTMAFKIIREHKGELEISSRPSVGTTARISLQRPDLPSAGRLFDGKI